MTAPDLASAERFLAMLGPRHTFQTFDDGPAKDRALSRVLHGTLAQHADTLADLNARGAGVFVMVNAGDGRGRKSDNVQQVRALFVDLDGAPLEPVTLGPLAPNVTVESSPGRYHAYWLTDDCALEAFKPIQQALAARFAADPKVCDLPRVMRVPGFLHRKGEPFRSRLLTVPRASAYTMAQVRAAFPAASVVPIRASRATARDSGRQRRTLPATIPEGQRNATLFDLACGLVRRGHDAAAVNDRLQRMNAERCQPPLCASEVDTIAANASRQGSDGFAMLPHVLLDSAEWKASARSVHEIVLTAFRRFDGNSEGCVALTWQDFEGRDGFSRKATFYAMRNAAVAAGFIELASEGRTTQVGRKPDLFRIASQWVPNVRRGKNLPQAQGEELKPLSRYAAMDGNEGLEVGGPETPQRKPQRRSA